MVDYDYLLKHGGPGKNVELQVTLSRLVPLPDVVVDINFFPILKGVCLAQIDEHCQAGYEDSPRAWHKRVCSLTDALLLLQTPQFHQVGTGIS